MFFFILFYFVLLVCFFFFVCFIFYVYFFNFYVRLGGDELETGCRAATAVPAHVCTPSDMVFTWTLVDLGRGPYPAGLELHSQTWQGTSELSWRLPPGCCARCLVDIAKPPPSYPHPDISFGLTEVPSCVRTLVATPKGLQMSRSFARVLYFCTAALF